MLNIQTYPMVCQNKPFIDKNNDKAYVSGPKVSDKGFTTFTSIYVS